MSQNARGAVVLSEKVFVPECSRCCSSSGESIYPRMLEVLPVLSSEKVFVPECSRCCQFYRRKYLSQNARGAVVLSEKVFIPECSRCCQFYQRKYLSQNRCLRCCQICQFCQRKYLSQNVGGAVVLPECWRCCSSMGESIYPRMLEVL